VTARGAAGAGTIAAVDRMNGRTLVMKSGATRMPVGSEMTQLLEIHVSLPAGASSRGTVAAAGLAYGSV
jgi:hypothetical protein